MSQTNAKTLRPAWAIKHPIPVALALGILFWILESAVDAFLLGHVGFAQALVSPAATEVLGRLAAAVVFLVFALYARMIDSSIVETRSALQESEHRYRSFVENFQGIAFRADLESQPVFLHGAVKKITGYTDRDIVAGRPHWHQIVHPDDLPAAQEAVTRLRSESNTAMESEYRIRHKDGRTIWVREFIRNVCDDHGRPVYTQGAIYDITSRKDMEEALLRAHADLEELAGRRTDKILQTAMDGFCIFDTDGQLLEVNDAFCEMIGLTRDRLLSMSIHELEIPASPGATADRIRMIIRDGAKRFESVYRRVDGSIVQVEVSTTYLDIEGGQIFAFSRDITDRKRAEETLKDNEAVLQSIFQAAPIGITLVSNRIFKWVNEQFREITGYATDELIGTNSRMLYESDEEFERVGRSTHIRGPETTTVETCWIRKDGKRIDVSLHGALIDSADPARGNALAVIDITENIKAAKALRESEERFRVAFQTSPDAIMISKMEDGLIIDVNCGFTTLSGFTKDEVLYKTTRDTDIWQSSEDRERFIARLQAHGYVKDMELPLRAKDKRLVTCLISSSIMTLDGEQYLLTAVHEVEELKKAERAIRESEEKHRTLFETMAQGVIYHNAAGEIFSVNPAAERIVGLTADELTGRTKADTYLHAIYEDGSECPNEERPSMVALATSRPVRNFILGVYNRRDQRLHWLSVDAVPQFKPGELKPYQVYTTFADITERREAGEALRKSRQRLRDLIEEAPDAIITLDLDGVITSCNAAVEKMSGYSRDEFVGKHISQLSALKPEDIPRYLELFKSIARGRDAKPIELVAVRKDGAVITIEMHFSLLREGGEITRIQTISRDITQRKEAEAALRRSEERYRQLVETSPIPIVVHADGNIAILNAAAVRTLGGQTANDLIGRSIMDFVHPDYRTVVRKRIESVYNKKGPAAILEEKFVRLDGEVIDVEVMASVVDLRGSPASQVVFHDITARKKAEKALFVSEKEKAIILNNVSELVIYKDTDLKIIWANRAAGDSVGLPPERLAGRYCYEIWGDGRRLCAECPVARALESGQSEEGEMCMPGDRIWLYRGYPVRDEQGEITGVVGVKRDITRRKRAELKLLEYQQQLRSLTAELSFTEQRERRQFATSLHDGISQNLVIANMWLADLSTKTLSEDNAATVKKIHRLISHALASTQTLTYDLSPPVLYRLGLEPALEGLIEEMADRYRLTVNLDVEGGEKPLAEDHRVVLYRAIRELLVNVVKHSETLNAKVRIGKRGDEVVIEVVDRGRGFDPGEIDTRSARHGGFGLFSIRERLSYLGGKLEIKSVPGHGTRVIMRAPMSATNVDNRGNE